VVGDAMLAALGVDWSPLESWEGSSRAAGSSGASPHLARQRPQASNERAVRAAELHSWAGASVAVVEVAANGEVVTGEESVTAASVCAALAWPQAARQGSTTLPVVAAVQGLHRPCV
jgi:hypothetical protein